MSSIENILNSVLSQLGAGSKEIVYVSVTPGVGLEMIQIDPTIKAVKLYGHKPLEYNDSMREIVNYDDFKEALQELFTELNLNPKCNVVLNLPMVHFGKVDLPLLLNDEAVTEAIISEVEQAYIFKRCEPVVSWFEANSPSGSSASENRTIFYSAVQKPAVDKIKEILTELGATLSGLEISLISSLRALSYSDLAATQMVNNTAWNLMVLNSSGYSIVAMSGKHIIDYYEEPLALKTYEIDEIYDVINASAQIALMNFPTNYLYIVSETDMVSAEHLASKLQVEGKIDYLENNSFRKNEIVPVSLNILPDEVTKISLEAIGIAVSRMESFPAKLEFSGNRSEFSGDGEESIAFDFKGREIVLTESVLQKIVLGIAGILILPIWIGMMALPKMQEAEKTKLEIVKKDIKEVDTQINSLKSQSSTKGNFLVATEVENVLKSNRTKLMAYSAIGESVPKNLWITYLSIDNSAKIDIKGVSENVENVYLFFRNMKDSLVNVNLRLHKLEMLSTSIDDAVSFDGPTMYEFQITNKSNVELNANTESVAAEQSDNKAKNGLGSFADKLKPGKKVNALEPVPDPED